MERTRWPDSPGSPSCTFICLSLGHQSVWRTRGLALHSGVSCQTKLSRCRQARSSLQGEDSSPWVTGKESPASQRGRGYPESVLLQFPCIYLFIFGISSDFFVYFKEFLRL